MKHADITLNSWYAWQGVSLEFTSGQLVQVATVNPLMVHVGRRGAAPASTPVACTADDLAPLEDSELLAAVWDHAKRNYSYDGWDIVVECWTDNDLAEVISGATDTDSAISNALAFVLKLADRRGDVEATADTTSQNDGDAPAAEEEPDGPTVALLVLHPNGDIEDVQVPHGSNVDSSCLGAFYRHMDCDTVDLVRLDGVDMWLDDEGLLTGKALNVPATYVAGQLVEPGQAIQPGYMGTVVFAGTTPGGSVASLPADKRDTIGRALSELRARQHDRRTLQD